MKPLLEERQLDMGHARALLAISNAVQQLDVARQIVKKGLSVRETERLIKHMLGGDGKPKPAKPSPAMRHSAPGDRGVREARRQGTSAARAKGAGKLVISYNSLDELDGILKHIK